MSLTEKPLSSLLANRQWWKVCWVYGDQAKYYRQLYGARKSLPILRNNPAEAASPTAEDDAAASVCSSMDNE